MKTTCKIIGFAFLINFVSNVLAGQAQTLKSFEEEFKWINIKACKRPPIKPPAPIWIMPPAKDEKTKLKKVSIRRWLDTDGDGLCELYDVQELEESFFTGKRYGYPYRRSTYENGKWKVQHGSVGAWLPIILLDKVNNVRFVPSYSYGNAGYSVGPKGPRPDCESIRRNLAEGYMLFFHFPKFAKDDPVMDPEGVWNDYKSGYVEAQYPTREVLLQSPVSADCKEKYRLVIDALARELEN